MSSTYEAHWRESPCSLTGPQTSPCHLARVIRKTTRSPISHSISRGDNHNFSFRIQHPQTSSVLDAHGPSRRNQRHLQGPVPNRRAIASTNPCDRFLSLGASNPYTSLRAASRNASANFFGAIYQAFVCLGGLSGPYLRYGACNPILLEYTQVLCRSQAFCRRHEAANHQSTSSHATTSEVPFHKSTRGACERSGHDAQSLVFVGTLKLVFINHRHLWLDVMVVKNRGLTCSSSHYDHWDKVILEYFQGMHKQK